MRLTTGLILTALVLAGCTFSTNKPTNDSFAGDASLADQAGEDAPLGDESPQPDVRMPDQADDAVPPDIMPVEVAEEGRAGEDVVEEDTGQPGCKNDGECDDGDPCTADMCDLETGICANLETPDLCGKCVEEGGTTGVYPDAPPCCEGLEPISPAEPMDNGECAMAEGAVFCAACGNGNCEEEWENWCNCPKDCPPPQVENICVIEGGLCTVPLPDEDGDGCPDNMSPVYLAGCPEMEICCMPDAECVGEGEPNPVTPDAPPCCEGLDPIPPSQFSPETGECLEFIGTTICSNCGNGSCEGEWENPCNCPKDCDYPFTECEQAGGECLPGDEGGACPNGSEGLWAPDCPDGLYCCFNTGECLGEGQPVPVTPEAPGCCPGLDLVGLAQFDPVTGDCIVIPGASVCTDCGNGKCEDWEALCTCPEDCGPTKPCLSEGEGFTDFETEGKCCPGLKPIDACFPEGDGCVCPNCPCYTCTYCGNGECGEGENWCNCPNDCG